MTHTVSNGTNNTATQNSVVRRRNAYEVAPQRYGIHHNQVLFIRRNSSSHNYLVANPSLVGQILALYSSTNASVLQTQGAFYELCDSELLLLLRFPAS